MNGLRPSRALRRTKACRTLCLAGLATSLGCASTGTLDQMDARTDQARAAAARELPERVRDPDEDLSERLAASLVLGRLRIATPEVVEGLAQALDDPRSPPRLRSYAAWALGELRSSASLRALTASLRVRTDPDTGYYLLEALAKHFSLLARDQARMVETVEAMVLFSSTQTSALPPIYDALGRRLKTMPVLVEVLRRASEALASKPSAPRVSACYAAAFELLEKLELDKRDIRAGQAGWRTRARAAVEELGRTLSHRERLLTILAVWYLGRLADVEPISIPAAEVLVGKDDHLNPGRPSTSDDPSTRLLAAWALSRLELRALGPRRALVTDLLPKEQHDAVLEILELMYRRGEP